MRYSKWGIYIRNLLDKYSENSIWSNLCKFNNTIKKVHDNLCKEFCKSWFRELHNDIRRNSTDKNKLRTYRLFKTDFVFEKYLVHIKNPVHRTLVTKFRISDYNIQMELARRCTPKIPADERFCKFCQNMVEDEFHHLILCSHYTNARKALLVDVNSPSAVG